MKTILVPTDYSEVAQNAIEYAAELAKAAKSKLILMHVYGVPMMVGEGPVIVPDWEDIETDCMKILNQMRLSIHYKYGEELNVECVCKMGFTVEEVVNYLEENTIDLVVMGMHGAGAVSEKLIGSTTTDLIKETTCPVLVINEHSKFKGLRKIVLASDFEHVPHKVVLEHLKGFITLFQSYVYILNVYNANGKEPDMDRASIGIGMEHKLEGVDHSFHFIDNEDVVAGINAFVEEKQADMVVLMPHKHKLFARLFHEPNTKRMVFHTSIPLLALRK